MSSLKKIDVIRNSLWNIFGQTASLLAVFVSIPILIRNIGDDPEFFLKSPIPDRKRSKLTIKNQAGVSLKVAKLL